MFRKTKKSIILIIIGALATGAITLAATGGGFVFKKTEAKGLVGHWPLSHNNEHHGTEQMGDGDMESASDWNSYSSPVTNEKNTTSPIRGTRDMHIVTDTAGWGGATKTINGGSALTAGKLYRISLTYRKISGSVTVAVGSAGFEFYALSNATATSNTRAELYFVPATSVAHSVWVVGQFNVASEFYIDDISITLVNAADATPNANDGTVYGATYTTDRNGQSNLAMSFDGTDYVAIDGVLTQLANTTSGSWSTWIKPTDATPASAELLISFGDTNAFEYLVVYLTTDGKLQFESRDSGTIQFTLKTDSAVFSDNTWTHIAIIQDGTSPVIYIDGVAVSQTFSNSTDKTSWFADLAGLDNGRIGDDNVNSGGELYFFTGSISDVRIYNYALTETEVGQLYGGYQGSKATVSDLSKGLVGHWPLDTDSAKSDTKVADITPNGNDGTLFNMTVSGSATDDEQGQSNRAMNFTAASSQYIRATNSPSLKMSVNAPFSVSYWLNLTSLSSYMDPICMDNFNDSFCHLIINSNNGLYIYTSGDVNPEVTYTNYFSAGDVGSWVLVSQTYDGDKIRLYKNGALLNTSSGGKTLAVTNNHFYIGSDGGSAYFMNGAMSDVRLYNRMLSDAEISQLYSSYRPKASTGSLTKGLVGYWSLKSKDLKSATIMGDATPYGNNGTITGATVGTASTTFDGSDYLTLTNASAIHPDTFSVSLWFTASAQDYLPVMTFGSANNYLTELSFSYFAGHYARIKGNDNNWKIFNNSAYATITDGNWHHAVFVVPGKTTADVTNYKFYLDGVSIATHDTVATQNWTTEGTIKLGRSDTNYYIGNMSDVRIYNRVLSAEEVGALYYKGQ